MKIKGILFDLDGTLANTIPLCIKSYRLVWQELQGNILTDEEITSHFGLTEDGIFQKTMPDRWELAFKLYLETYEKLHHECAEPFAGIVNALDLLKERVLPWASLPANAPIQPILRSNTWI
ncbi:hypothetical protein EPA93_21495 [Ktedonosporobacter rubrisoli]|uniref:HAD family hydrolase n=1 Tax=Ktedonosporobacter rubrisoli TaxID=2509675 RepID=A0A4P6JSD4_KTERU|nr:hypothetical protein EPA93_21495 [Ktedonosporobacter rubrisoli]